MHESPRHTAQSSPYKRMPRWLRRSSHKLSDTARTVTDSLRPPRGLDAVVSLHQRCHKANRRYLMSTMSSLLCGYLLSPLLRVPTLAMASVQSSPTLSSH